jgi:fatty-acyl-CoA synthase
VNTLVSLLQARAEESGDRPALFLWGRSDQREQYSHADLARGAFGYAAFLREQGIEPGDRVLLVMLTRVEFFYAFFGCMLVGALPVPVHPPMFILEWDDYRAKFLHIVARAKPSLIFCYRDIKEAVEKKCLAQQECPPVVNVEDVAWDRGAGSGWRWPSVGEADVAYIQYTSGTTGLPKGARLTHGALIRNVRAIGEHLGLTEADTAVSWLPLYHDMGLIGNFLTPLYWQCQVCLLPTEFFVMQPTTFFKVIHQFKATGINSPNFGYVICNKYTKQRSMEGLNLSSLRFSLVGADHIECDDLEEYHDRFAPYRMSRDIAVPVYGMSECCLAVTISTPGDPLRVEHVDRETLSATGEAVPGAERAARTVPVFAVGSPIDGVRVSVRDDRGRELPDGFLGTIWVNSTMVMEEYLDSPDETSAVMQDGWFNTRDLGYVRDGTLFYFERVADCMRHHGTLYRPKDFEVLCTRIPDIKRGRSAAFGMRADAVAEHEDIHLVIETGTLYEEKYREIVNGLNALHQAELGRVADFVYVVARGSIPQTSSGKLQRGKCRSRVIDGSFDVHFHFDNRRGEVLYCK